MRYSISVESKEEGGKISRTIFPHDGYLTEAVKQALTLVDKMACEHLAIEITRISGK